MRRNKSFQEQGKKQFKQGEQQIKVENILKYSRNKRIMSAVKIQRPRGMSLGGKCVRAAHSAKITLENEARPKA